MSDTSKTESPCGCGCGEQAASIHPLDSLDAGKRKGFLNIQFMYIDLSLCTR